MNSSKVALLVGDVKPEGIHALAKEMPVWLLDSLISKGDLDNVRATTKFPVTTFWRMPAETLSDTVARAISAIEEHHGEASSSEPYQSLLVLGAQLSDQISQVLRDFGFERTDQHNRGFTAQKGDSGR